MMSVKKILRPVGMILLIAALLLSAAVISSATDYYYGDADLNGKVQATDARRILRHVAKLELLTDARALALADVDGSGRITSGDARLALRMASKLDPTAIAPAEILTTEEPSAGTEATTAPEIPTLSDPSATEIPSQTDPSATEIPATAEPTTETPTTAEPATVVPTSAAPTSEAPATEAPTTEAPTTATPTTEAPTAAAPTTETPTTTEPPTTEAPTTTAPDRTGYYDKYYFEMADEDGNSIAAGMLNGTQYIETAGSDFTMAVILEPDGQLTIVNHDTHQYATLTAAEQNAFAKLMRLRGEEPIDFSGMFGALASKIPAIPTPERLLADGYVKSAGAWNGKPADVYTSGNSAYYFSGRTLLASVTKAGEMTYSVFTEDPEPYIYKHIHEEYSRIDFLIFMTMMMSSGTVV